MSGCSPSLPALLGALVLSFGVVHTASSQTTRAYVGSQACADCHVDATAAWANSHHALAWTEATPDNVRADFNGTVFESGETIARFRTGMGKYYIDVTEKDGATTEYPVHSVAGIEPLQQYLLETEPGRLQSFDMAWDTEKGGWFDLYPNSDLPPDDAFHWTGPYKTWNARCAECHATGFQKNYNSVTYSYASTQVEMGVGCEACHGPGSDHVDWAATTRQSLPPQNYGFSVDFSDTETAIQQCVTCHSRREAHLDGNPLPGTPFQDSYALSLLQEGSYHADGQIREEVYVYGSFLQSKMYAQGVGCLNCHRPHAADLVAEGNAVCTQCHSPAGNPDFPTLRRVIYDDPTHHFHTPGSEGAQCKNCHAPEKVYMGNDWRADHSFRVPRPDLADVTGAPDACTSCHQDRDSNWAATEIRARFPESTYRGAHYGEVLARGRQNAAIAAPDLELLALDGAEAGIIRATALWLLEQSSSPTTAERLVPLLHDPDPLVRAAAVGVQRLAPLQTRVSNVLGLLDDPMRSVRIAAARAMLDVPIAQLPEQSARDMRAAMADWQGSIQNRLDFPETQLQIAGISLTTRDFVAAERAFAEVVRLDPKVQEAWIMRIRIAAAMKGPEAALEITQAGLIALPGDAVLISFRDELSGQSP